MLDASSGAVHGSKCRTIATDSRIGQLRKTIITANLALSLAQQFRGKAGSVVAVDLDLGCGNLNACLGVRSPNGTINSFLLNKVSDLEQILTPTEQENLQMICSSYSGTPEMKLEEELKKELLKGLGNLDANYVLVDLGAGTAPEVLDFFLGANEKIVVITPEALSLHNAFVFLKAAILRFLWGELEREEFLSPVKSNLRWMIEDEKDLNIGKLIERLKGLGPLRSIRFGGSDQRSQNQVCGEHVSRWGSEIPPSKFSQSHVQVSVRSKQHQLSRFYPFRSRNSRLRTSDQPVSPSPSQAAGSPRFPEGGGAAGQR